MLLEEGQSVRGAHGGESWEGEARPWKSRPRSTVQPVSPSVPRLVSTALQEHGRAVVAEGRALSATGDPREQMNRIHGPQKGQ